MILWVKVPNGKEYIADIYKVIPLINNGVCIVHNDGHTTRIDNAIEYQTIPEDKLVGRFGKFYHEWMGD